MKSQVAWVKDVTCEHAIEPKPTWACDLTSRLEEVPASWDTTTTTTTVEQSSETSTTTTTVENPTETTTVTTPTESTTTGPETTTAQAQPTETTTFEANPIFVQCPPASTIPCGDDGQSIAMCKFNFRKEVWHNVCIDPYEIRTDEMEMKCGRCPEPEPYLQCPAEETVPCGKNGERLAICEKRWNKDRTKKVFTTRCANPNAKRFKNKEVQCGCCESEELRKKPARFCPVPNNLPKSGGTTVTIENLTCSADSAETEDDVERCGKGDKKVWVCHERRDGKLRNRCVDPRQRKWLGEVMQCGKCSA